jgi:secreted trypsin-like serine protease
VSGYGISFSSKKLVVSFRERLQALSTLVNTNSTWNDGFNVQTNGNGDARGGTCTGDSGGPVFWPGDVDSNVIVAITSFGKTIDCRGTDFSYRVDRAVVIDFIREFTG